MTSSELRYASKTDGYRGPKEIAALRPARPNVGAKPEKIQPGPIREHKLCVCGCGRGWSSEDDAVELARHMWDAMRPILEAKKRHRSRTIEGLIAAKERYGGQLPRRGPSIDPLKIAKAVEMYRRGDMEATQIAKSVGISRASLYRALQPGGRIANG